jgi:hypothetical protein
LRIEVVHPGLFGAQLSFQLTSKHAPHGPAVSPRGSFRFHGIRSRRRWTCGQFRELLKLCNSGVTFRPLVSDAFRTPDLSR